MFKFITHSCKICHWTVRDVLFRLSSHRRWNLEQWGHRRTSTRLFQLFIIFKCFHCSPRVWHNCLPECRSWRRGRGIRGSWSTWRRQWLWGNCSHWRKPEHCGRTPWRTGPSAWWSSASSTTSISDTEDPWQPKGSRYTWRHGRKCWACQRKWHGHQVWT